MRWESSLEDMESSQEEMVENDYDLTSEDGLVAKLYELLGSYEAVIELFNLGEEVSNSVSVIDDAFDMCLIMLEVKHNYSEEMLDDFRNKRNLILKSYLENKNKKII